MAGRERRGFGAVGPGERKKGTIVPTGGRGGAGGGGGGRSPIKPKKKKKKKQRDFRFPTIEIQPQRKDIDISVGARQPPTILLTSRARKKPKKRVTPQE